MIVRDVILCKLAPVLFHLLLQKVGSVGLLQQDVPGIFLVPQDVLDGAGGPGRPPSGREDAVAFQSGRDLARRVPAQEAVEDAGDDSRPLRLDFRFSTGALAVAQEVAVVEGELPFLVLPPLSHRDILADGFALRLSEGAEPGEVDFAADVAGVQSLLFKLYRHIQAFEQPDVGDGIEGVAGEAAQGFGENEVDFVPLAFLDHSHEFGADGVFGPADAPVGKDTGALPFGIALDEVGIVLHLILKAAFLLLLLGADPAVGGHPEPFATNLVLQKGVCGDFADLFAMFLHGSHSSMIRLHRFSASGRFPRSRSGRF